MPGRPNEIVPPMLDASHPPSSSFHCSEDLIVLYDIPSAILPDKAWSPNVWKVRLVLNYKGLPYRTEWTESPDLASTAKQVGAPPNMLARSGRPLYLAPILYCPRSKRYISNSLEIAIHLERTYPESPSLFRGAASEALVRAWDEHWNNLVAKRMGPLMVERTFAQLTPRSAARFQKSREMIFGMPLSELAPPDKAPALWNELGQALTRIDGFIRDARFVAGDEITYPDIIIVGWLTWVKRLYGPESLEWKTVEQWNQGRWKRLMDACSQWEYTDAISEIAKL